MDKFLETKQSSKTESGRNRNLNRLITSKEIKSIIIILKIPTNKSPGLDSFTGELYQTFKEDLIPILLKLFQKTEEVGTLSNSFYEASITLIPKTG